jgi:hypothetical protein
MTAFPDRMEGCAFAVTGDVLIRLADGTELPCGAAEVLVIVGGEVLRLQGVPQLTSSGPTTVHCQAGAVLTIQCSPAVSMHGDHCSARLEDVGKVSVEGSFNSIHHHHRQK